MKKLVLACLLALPWMDSQAQCPIAVGQMQFNAGLGFSSSGIPIYAGLDYGIHKDITVGAEGSFRHYDDDWEGKSYGHSGIGIVGNGNYHFNSLLKMPTKWDFYAGVNLGFNLWISADDYNGDISSGFGFGGQVGGRYYFNEKMGINLEVGGGNTMAGSKFGISMKL